jgi:predicted ester cyclase
MASLRTHPDSSGRYREWLAAFHDAAASRQRALVAELVAHDAAWHVCRPIETCTGRDVFDAYFAPLFDALPDLERQDDISIAGWFGDRPWRASTGHYVGTFERAWLGIPPTRGAVTIRFGEFVRFDQDHIVEAYVLLDVLDVLRQAGRQPLPPSLGAADRVPGPITGDGVITQAVDASESRTSLDLVEAMIAGLMQYDGVHLASMGMERFWHPRMMWYGPCGIGTTRGLSGFQRYHQQPFLHAFPDRRGGNHKCRIAQGHYVASTGWPSVQATHQGAGWLGVPATGRRIGMRVMDFWRRDGDVLRENWVFIDLVDLLHQFGIDALALAGVSGTDS